MPGQFSKSFRPARPGSYTDFLSQTVVAVNAPLNGVVAIPIVHDWGPFKQIKTVESWQEFQQLFGYTDTLGSRAVYMAFKGEGIYNRGGASQVKVYRTGGSAALKASRIIQNTTPANAIKISAKYEGTWSNGLTTQVITNALNAENIDFILFSPTGQELERYTVAKTAVEELATKINAESKYITATKEITGTALKTDVSPVALASGNNGETLIAEDWTKVREAFETERFSVFTPYKISEESLLAAFALWVKEKNEKGKRFIAVFGATATGSATAITNAAVFNSPYSVVVGGGELEDTTMINAATNATWKLLPSEYHTRVAGIVAARGERQSITFARLGDVKVVTGPTDAEILKCLEGGVVTYGQDSVAVAPVRIEKGLTTYKSNTVALPYKIYSVIKFVRIMGGIEMDLTEYAEANVIGQLPVNDGTRETLVAEMKAIIRLRAENQIVHDGFTVEIDREPPPTDSDEFIQVKYGVTLERSTEQVFNTVYVG